MIGASPVLKKPGDYPAIQIRPDEQTSALFEAEFKRRGGGTIISRSALANELLHNALIDLLVSVRH